MGLDPEALKLPARAVVVKDRDERDDFERAWTAWCEATKATPAEAPEARIERPVVAERRQGAPRAAPVVERRRRSRGWRVGLAIGLVLTMVAVWWATRSRVQPPPPEPVPIETVEPRVTVEPIAPAAVTVTVWVPELGPVRTTPRVRLDALTVGILALLGGLSGLAVWFRRERPEPPPPPPEDRGRPVPEVGADETGAPLLLAVAEQERMVWGATRRVTVETTARLDGTETALATSEAAGIPQLRFEVQREEVPLQLWVDRTADEPLLYRLADELQAVLEGAGLQLERADFVGWPAELHTAEEVTSPFRATFAQRRAPALVLTDGRVWVHEHEGDVGRHLAPLHQELAAWEAVLVIEVGDGSLKEILGPLGIRVVAPEEVATALGGTEAAAVPAPSDLRLWAAACALHPAPLTEEVALRLRRDLALEVGVWWLGTLISDGTLDASPRARAGALGWLERALGTTHAPQWPPRIPSELDDVLKWWDERHAETERVQSTHAEWQGSRAQAEFEVQRSLMQLWRAPETSLAALVRHHQRTGMTELVEDGVGHLMGADDDSPQPTAIRLPWRLVDLAARDAEWLVKLREIGFGRRIGLEFAGLVRPPGRRALGLGVLAAVAVLAFAVAALDRPALSEPIPEVDEVPSDRGGVGGV